MTRTRNAICLIVRVLHMKRFLFYFVAGFCFISSVSGPQISAFGQQPAPTTPPPVIIKLKGQSCWYEKKNKIVCDPNETKEIINAGFKTQMKPSSENDRLNSTLQVAGSANGIKAEFASMVHYEHFNGPAFSKQTYNKLDVVIYLRDDPLEWYSISVHTTTFTNKKIWPAKRGKFGCPCNTVSANTTIISDKDFSTEGSINSFQGPIEMINGMKYKRAYVKTFETMASGAIDLYNFDAGFLAEASLALNIVANHQFNDASLRITEANIIKDKIVIDSAPSFLSGKLKVELEGFKLDRANGEVLVQKNSASVVLFNDTHTGNTRTLSFKPDLLPAETDFWTVKATWAIPGISPLIAEKAVEFLVLGNINHSQYNTPYEGTCPNPKVLGKVPLATDSNGSCTSNDVEMIKSFIFRVSNPIGGTGSGRSINYGIVLASHRCTKAIGRSLMGGTLMGRCGAVNDNTVAVAGSRGRVTHPYVGFGDEILIRGLGSTSNETNKIKTVTDLCPACESDYHFDNYTTDERCEGVSGLGRHQTILLRHYSSTFNRTCSH